MLVAEDLGQLQDLIDTEPVVVVKFTAPSWCIPCRRFAPHFESVANKVDGVSFVSVDIDDVFDAVDQYKVQGVPTVILFKDGEPVGSLAERTAVKFQSEVESYL